MIYEIDSEGFIGTSIHRDIEALINIQSYQERRRSREVGDAAKRRPRADEAGRNERQVVSMSTNSGQIVIAPAKSRWISVRNDGELEVPPFAPCYFILRVDYQSEEQPIVLPFPGKYRPEANSPHVANPSNYSICFMVRPRSRPMVGSVR